MIWELMRIFAPMENIQLPDKPAGLKAVRKAFKDVRASYLNRIRWAVSLFYFSMGLTFATWASRIPHIKDALHLSEGALGTVLFCIPCGQLLAMPFSGRIATRFGSHKTTVIGMLGYITAMALLGFATTPWHLMVTLFFFGIFSNLTNISLNTQGIYTEGIFHRPIMSSFHGVWSLAGLSGALIGLLMVNLRLDPKAHFGLVALALYMVILLNRSYLIKVRPKLETPEKKQFLSRPNPRLVWLGVIGFCSMVSEGIMFDWSGVYFKDVVKAPENIVVLGYASFMVMMAAGRFLGDRVIGRYGRKRVMQVAGCCISIGLYAAVLFPYLIPAALAFMLVGLGVSTIVPSVYSLAGRTPGVNPSLALTTVSSVSFLGFMIGPPVIGHMAQAFGLKFSFALIGMFGVGIAFLVKKVNVQ